MPSRPTIAPPDAEHEAQAAEQAQIESQVTTDPTPPVDPPPVVEEPTDVPPEVVVEQEQTATIKSVNVTDYPIHVGLAGAPEEYTFTDESTTFDVPLAVAEQVTYVPYVEVVA